MRSFIIRLFLLSGLFFSALASVAAPLNLATGWNLLGNSSASPLDVATTFGDASKIITVWKWDNATGKWAFYAPSMTPSALTTYAQGMGYDVLTSIAPKEGFWVSASTAVALAGPAANGVMLVESDLSQGWNLVGSADNKTPSQLNQGLSSSLNAAGKVIVTAWAWDAPSTKWKFYAPSLEAKGGAALSDYITAKGYLPFSTPLPASDGLWLNVVTTVAGGMGLGATPPAMPMAMMEPAMSMAAMPMELAPVSPMAMTAPVVPMAVTTPVMPMALVAPGTKMGGAIQGKALGGLSVATTLAGSGKIGAVNGIGTAASFFWPGGITTDGTNLYVLDTSNNKIRKIVIATGAVTTLAGSGAGGAVEGIGTAASFNYPGGITTDGTNLYVADNGNHKIRKIVIATGAVTTLAGSGAIGAVDGIGTAASFNYPSSITTDGINLYVAEANNNKIRKIVIASGEVSTLAGGGSTGSVEGHTNGIGTAALFFQPGGITTDGNNLYVADTQNKLIRKIVIASGEVTTLAGGGYPATDGSSTDGIGTAASFSQPRNITSDGINLYVTEGVWKGDFAIRRIVIATGDVTTLVGGSFGGITTNGANLFVTDIGNNRISKIAAGGKPTITGMSAGATGTTATFTGTNFSATPAANIVKFSGVTSTYKATVTVAKTTSLIVTIPNDATNGKVSVTTPGGTTTSAGSFMLMPYIYSIGTHSGGGVGDAATIAGANFSTTPANNTVQFNGTKAVVTAATAGFLTVTVPSGATNGKVTVKTAGGTATSANNFTIPPTVTGMSPSAGGEGTTVTIAGANFRATPANNTVKFNGTPATVTAATAKSLTVKVPTGVTVGVTWGGVPSAIQVSVTTADGTAMGGFTMLNAPTVTGISPSAGGAGTTVTITGTDFGITPAANTVKFYGAKAVVTAATATSLTVKAPSGATTGPISVTTAGGTALSAVSFVAPIIVTGSVPSSCLSGQKSIASATYLSQRAWKNTATGEYLGFSYMKFLDGSPNYLKIMGQCLVGGHLASFGNVSGCTSNGLAVGCGTTEYSCIDGDINTAGSCASLGIAVTADTIQFKNTPVNIAGKTLSLSGSLKPPPPPPPSSGGSGNTGACAKLPYTNIGSTYDYQIDSQCQLAQNIQCMYDATKIAQYLTNKSKVCAIVQANKTQFGVVGNCHYCP